MALDALICLATRCLANAWKKKREEEKKKLGWLWEILSLSIA